jgi:DEAD/DEAH box helicase domain-containing protein
MTTTLNTDAVMSNKSATQNASVQQPADLVTEVLETIGLPVHGRLELPGREATYSEPPAQLDARVREILADAFPAGLYSHQAKAIAASLNGEDICLATSTASGKSLVFMATAMHELVQDPHARVLVLYPARALIQDQLAKWTGMLARLGLKAGFIDGGVRQAERNEILLCRQVVLMTPDVAHAWFMSRLNDPGVAAFRKHLRLLILDEAHVYDGVFGTNMAFFLRRLQAAATAHRLICSTATLGASQDFIQSLTGRQTRLIGSEQEGSNLPSKTIILARRDANGAFESTPELVRSLALSFPGRFLVFSDSRKAVETLTAASHRKSRSAGGAQEDCDEAEVSSVSALGVMPYRAGYEAADRLKIQEALAKGELRGIVSTSALELGLDIGEIDLVVLLDTPPSLKSFWQRLGRTGRAHAGFCIIIDTRHVIDDGAEGIRGYLSRPLEPNWLYLDNRYVQYTNALCAASEIAQINGSFDKSRFESLPPQFMQFLEDELNPGVPVAQDLYPLKQAAAAGPHREFPLRSGVEKNFRVTTPQGASLGELSFSQALREAYPGAVYYYMATPYRVRQFKYRDGEIIVSREKHYSTKPVVQVMVFPDFQNGLLKLARSTDGFLVEADVQVSERVTGFKEKRGNTELPCNYQPGSPYSQQPLQRLIRTSGVCWHFPQGFAVSEAVAQSILAAFCTRHGIQSRDVGIGRFHSRQSPLGKGPANGICLFDNANGSLRLTERLAETFTTVVTLAAETEQKQGNEVLAQQLEALAELAANLVPVTAPNGHAAAAEVATLEHADSLVTVVADGEKALFTGSDGTQEVTIMNSFYTPRGLHYQLVHPKQGLRWTVSADCIEPINGLTRTVLLDLMTGEQQAAA